jgi:hypothetical protein
MPEVDGKKYAYDEKGKKAAAAAKKRMKGKTPPLKPGGGAEQRPDLSNFRFPSLDPKENVLQSPNKVTDEVHLPMMKGGKRVKYKTMSEKQADIRKHDKAKADEKAARKRGVEAHEAKKGEKKPRSRAQVRGAAEKRRLQDAEKRLSVMRASGGFAGSLATREAMKAMKKKKVKKRRDD